MQSAILPLVLKFESNLLYVCWDKWSKLPEASQAEVSPVYYAYISVFEGYWEPHLARLNNHGKYNAWSTDQRKSWIQVRAFVCMHLRLKRQAPEWQRCLQRCMTICVSTHLISVLILLLICVTCELPRFRWTSYGLWWSARWPPREPSRCSRPSLWSTTRSPTAMTAGGGSSIRVTAGNSGRWETLDHIQGQAGFTCELALSN